METEAVPLKPLSTSMIGQRRSGEHEPLTAAQRSTAAEEEDDIDEFISRAFFLSIPMKLMVGNEGSSLSRYARPRLFWAFLIFGLLNNVLYVIILSAAIDLVPATTPKGIIAFFNVFPAVLAKVFWPLISNGTVRYTRRVGFCTATSWMGIVIVALSPGLYARLFGISLASLSSGLGELTFLQLTTTLPSRSASKTALGAWASGTGAAGIAGAAIWWLLRGLGVKGGLGLSSFLPLFFPLVYTFLLPPWSDLRESSIAYQPIPTGESITPVDAVPPPLVSGTKTRGLRLSTNEKMALLRPLLLRYMLPLCLVYIAEYVINSGVAPTLVFPLPTTGIWSTLFKSPRDYYPFWSLTYQSFVFLSRSSLALGIPPIPRRFLPLPTVIQCINLIILSLQAAFFLLTPGPYTPPATPPSSGSDATITRVFLLICLEGLCGGSAYVNTFYHVGREGDVGGPPEGEEDDKTKMEREFRIGATGAADSTGILLASLFSMPLELGLCQNQVDRGRTMCRDL